MLDSFLSRITWSRSDRLSSDGLSNLDHGGYGEVAHRRPHVEVSEDYYAIFASNRSRQPEHHLMRAVLEHAIRAAQDDAKGSRALKKRREAIAWVVNEDRSHLFTFESVCETLGINARWLRAKLDLVKGETAIQIDREEVALAPTGEPPQLEDRSTREIGYSGGSGPPEDEE